MDNSGKVLVEKLTRSKIFKDYEQAFRSATGLPFALTPPETWGLPMSGDVNEGAFCQVMAGASKSCAACLEIQGKLSENGASSLDPVTMKCFAGFCDTAVPVRLGESLVGFLRTGQVRNEPPTEDDFDRTTQQLIRWGIEFDVKKLKDAYFASKVISNDQYGAMIRLLKVFADHLSMISNQVLVREETTENPMITRAKDYIERNQSEDISLSAVARAVNTSTFYFCKMFKKASGLTFTEYLGRVRVEKAKQLLLNPHVRVSEVAFEVGFQSLSQFNRVFKRITGQSPSDYRERLPKAGAVATARR